MKMKKKTCSCGGTGRIECDSCKGDKGFYSWRHPQWGDDVMTCLPRNKVWSVCERCEGKGDIVCPTCNGRGEIMVKSSSGESEGFNHEDYTLYNRYGIIINAATIDRNIFKTERCSSNQEWLRQSILEAFDEVDRNPQKYLRPFKTYSFTYRGINNYIKIKQIIRLCYGETDGMADWVQFLLECAQLISNGLTKHEEDPWAVLCNKEDKEDKEYFYDRIRTTCLVLWKTGHVRASKYPELICGGDLEDDEKVDFNNNYGIRALTVKYI